MATLLSLIGENERFRLKPKNLNGTDDVIENGFSSYLDDYGTTAIQDYSDDVNTESPSVSEVGDIALRDSKDYNIFPQDTYSEAEVERIDVSVIDMPGIDEISEDIYLSRTIYNKYSNLQYIPLEVLDAVGVQNYDGTYGDYIGTILSNLEQRGNTLADIFIGRWNLEDSPIGVIGGEALYQALTTQFKDGVSRKVVGILNKNVLSLLEGDALIREDYEITNPKNRLARAAEFAAKLISLENPLSYLPEDVFNYNRNRVVTNGKVRYIGSELTYKDQVALILQYTGKGQEKQLLSLVDLNIYKNEIEGRTRTIRANTYTNFIKGAINNLDNSDFIVKGNLIIPAPDGYYEPYGVISRHKNNDKSFGTPEKQLFSDGFWFVWTTDAFNLTPSVVDESYSVGWVARDNPFKSKSLLYKTQELVNSQQAFLDLSKKEFIEIVDGDPKIISRGDATTASGEYKDDDGTLIEQGEYFRVWTKQRGYNRLDRTLRHRGLDNGEKRSVLNNGIPNYAPTIREANRSNGLVSDEVIKRYMLSLENLAWNDHMDDLPECEQGPGDPLTGTRGRIMWFPPYDLSFDESVTASWQDHAFIGRGEKIWTYTNTERSGNLSFKILVDHPDIVHIQSLVGEKTQFWERYFKGDKLVQEEAIKRYKELTKLSQKELDEIKKIQNNNLPRFKKVPVKVKPKKEVEQKKAEETKKKVDENKKKLEENSDKKKENQQTEDKIETKDLPLGALLLSVYFPNDETTIPLAPVKYNYSSEDDSYTVDNNLSLKDLQLKNYGYEGGPKINELGFLSSDKYTIENISGLKYKLQGSNTAVNINYTYKEGKLVSNQYVCNNFKISAIGYKDGNNLGLNNKFYFEWKSSFLKLLKGVKKAKVTIMGNASGAIPVGRTNTALASGRANNVKTWVEQNVLKLLQTLNQDTTGIEIVTQSQGDLEDVALKQQNDELEKNGLAGIPFCQDCDESDKEQCKKTRRVDIFVKVLDEVVVPPVVDPNTGEPNIPPFNPTGSTITPVEDKPIVEPPVETTIEDLETSEELIPDDTQDNVDPNGDPNEPVIDPAILRKLVYTECDFFKYLETDQPFTYQTISEKIKYFTPAFHSITPQGLNSRLTFLHQCTRQGDSIGMDGVDNIKNLAFGRPPVCILRIGDFFHVKIIIETLTIKYANDTITWDTNPEGIGVQPMVADVSLAIKILGGMSLTAPINRLQNALSFNFYANTEVYDKRADSVVFEQKFDKDGKLDIDSTYGTLKAAKIVDGIKLSSLIKLSEAQKQKRLAKIRLESRLVNPTSTEPVVSTEKITTSGDINSLLEYKANTGVPLTAYEQIMASIGFETKNKFLFESLDPKDSKSIKDTMVGNLQDEKSLLNQQAEQIYKTRFNSKNPDDVAYLNRLLKTEDSFSKTPSENPFPTLVIPPPENPFPTLVIPSSENAYTNFVQSVFQYTQASVSDPNDITEEDAKRTSEEYIRAYGKVWIDPNTLRKR
jgi:hypothetical protein